MYIVPWADNVDTNKIGEFLRDEKWRRVRDRIILLNEGRNSRHQVKISKKAILLRDILQSLDIDIFPAVFRTYEINRGQGQWSWEVLSWNLNGYGSYEPFKDILRTGFLSVTFRNDDIFSLTEKSFADLRNTSGICAVRFEVNKGKVKILETINRR